MYFPQIRHLKSGLMYYIRLQLCIHEKKDYLLFRKKNKCAKSFSILQKVIKYAFYIKNKNSVTTALIFFKKGKFLLCYLNSPYVTKSASLAVGEKRNLDS